MFRGKAELNDPDTHTIVATFNEVCKHSGAKAKVVLKQPITLTGMDRLAIYSTIKDQEVIFAVAQNGGPTEIREFEGKSSLGCLPDYSEISLTKSPGGPLGTLLIVLAQGTIREEH